MNKKTRIMHSKPLGLLLLLFPIALQAQEELPVGPDSSGIYRIVDEMPRFPGCESSDMTLEEKQECSSQKLLLFLYTQIRYPAIARENGIEGTVLIRFVVEPDGFLSNIEIAREIGGGCGAEAQRVITSMNAMKERWIPGRQKGEAVRVLYLVPIKYKLEGKGKVKKKKKGRG